LPAENPSVAPKISAAIKTFQNKVLQILGVEEQGLDFSILRLDERRKPDAAGRPIMLRRVDLRAPPAPSPHESTRR
jgi:hypothetical protein